MENEDKLVELEALLQVTFRDRSLLQRAVTHHSCCSETAVHDSYDTLEFLGDAIIGAHVVEHIYRTFPDASEGEMTSLKSEVVSRRILAKIGQALGLFPYIRVDIANLRTFNERSRDSLCADVLEALVGAIQIDQGPEAARDFILQRSGSLPRYRVLEQSGRNNDRVFTVGVFEQDLLLAMGKASSIKEAGRLAARQALELMSEK